MARKANNIKAKVIGFPKKICDDGIHEYGETSMDNCLAVLTHYLHNEPTDGSQEDKLLREQIDDH